VTALSSPVWVMTARVVRVSLASAKKPWLPSGFEGRRAAGAPVEAETGGNPMTPVEDPPSDDDSKPAKQVPGRATKFLLTSLGALLVCYFWFIRQWQGQAFQVQGQGGGLTVDVVPLAVSVLALFAVSVLAGLIGMGSLEVEPLRIVAQGVALLGLLVAVAMERVPAAKIANASVPTTTARRVEKVQPTHAPAALSWATTAYARPSAPPPRPALQPPDLSTRVGWGLRTLTGGYADNWHVEVGRYRTFAGADSAAMVLSQQLKMRAVAYELCFAAGGRNASAWLPCDSDRRRVHVEYVVLLGADVSPGDAQRRKAAAERAGVTARAWQRPQPAFPPIERLGAHLVRQRGAAAEIVLDSSYAATHAGADWLIVKVALAGSQSSAASIARESIGVVSPDGQTLPLATQGSFASGHASLTPKLRAAAIASASVHEHLRGSLEDCGWYQVESGGPLVVDALHVRSGTVCAGFLAFQVPGGVTQGSWRLVVDLPGGPLRVPFEIE